MDPRILPNFKTRQDEIFKRMKVSSLVTLVLQMAQIKADKESIIQVVQQHENEDLDPRDQTKEDSANAQNSAIEKILRDPVSELLEQNGIITTERATFQSVIQGVGEVDFQTETDRKTAKALLAMKTPVDTMCPYLLLDVRTADEFAEGHIISAQNYPFTQLSKSVNYATPAMCAYRNQPGKVVVLYDDEELCTSNVATTLVQRGFDNVCVLSGGLAEALRKYPNGLVSGKISEITVASAAASSEGGLSSASPSSVSRRLKSAMTKRSKSVPSLAAQQRHVAITENVGAVRSTENTKRPVFAKQKLVLVSPLRDVFTTEDLKKLRSQLEFNLMPASSRSRLVRATMSTTATKREKAGGNSAGSIKAKKPNQPAWH